MTDTGVEALEDETGATSPKAPRRAQRNGRIYRGREKSGKKTKYGEKMKGVQAYQQAVIKKQLRE